MARILVRADGDSNIGLGHLFRALSLGEMLDHEGMKAGANSHRRLFYTRCNLPDIHAMLAKRGYEVVLLEKDEEPFLSSVRATDLVVMDGYHFSEEMQRRIRSQGGLLIMIDDLADRHQVADVVVNHAPFFEREYSCELYTRLCIGPQFAILRSEFLERGMGVRERLSHQGILVAFGGADPLDLTGKYLPRLAEVFPDEEIHVILGAGYKHESATKLAGLGTNVVLHTSVTAEELFMHFVNVRLAVLPASTMAMEAIACRCPVLAGWFVDNQHELYKGLAKGNAILPLGDLREMSADALAKKVMETLDALPQGLEKQLEQQQYNFLDGRSWERLRSIVEMAQHLGVRMATADDMQLYFDWANEPSVREASFHSEAITLENHQRWFERRLADPDSFLYLFTWDDVPCGQVRIQNEADGAVIGISIDGGFRGKGLSAELLVRASGNFFRQTKISQIFAYIKHENTASQRAFQAAGFIADGSAVVNGVECLKYVRKRQAS